MFVGCKSHSGGRNGRSPWSSDADAVYAGYPRSLGARLTNSAVARSPSLEQLQQVDVRLCRSDQHRDATNNQGDGAIMRMVRSIRVAWREGE